MLAGALVGALVGFIPGILRARFNANEMVSSLMLNYALLYFGLYILKNFFIDRSAGQGRHSGAFPATAACRSSCRVPACMPAWCW